MLLDWIKKNPWLTAIIILLIVVGAEAHEIGLLNYQIQNALVNIEDLKKAIQAQGKPVIVQAPIPSTNQKIDVTIHLQPGTPATTTQPVTPPKLVAVAPPVICKTVEECQKMFSQAPQSIAARGAVKKGTIVAVCNVPLVNNNCPAGQEVNKPLSQDYPFDINMALTDKGIFTVILPSNSPLTFTTITTYTPVEIKQPIGQIPSYHLGFAASIISSPFATIGIIGPQYQNLAWGGIYRITAGEEGVLTNNTFNTGQGVQVEWVLPIW
jgi:hypothetical protein